MLTFNIANIFDLYEMCNTRLGDVLTSVVMSPSDQPRGTAGCINSVVALLRHCLHRDSWISYFTWSFLLGLLIVDLVVFTYCASTYLGMLVTPARPSVTTNLRKVPPLVNGRDIKSPKNSQKFGTLRLREEKQTLEQSVRRAGKT
ncbi:hypothetical protein V1509DRAFT_622540 [Lipomyces kononenkoae]